MKMVLLVQLLISALNLSCAAYVEHQMLTAARSACKRVAVHMDESVLAEPSTSSSKSPSSTDGSNHQVRGDVLVLRNPMYLKRKAPVKLRTIEVGRGRAPTERETGGMEMAGMDSDGLASDAGPRSGPSRKVFTDRDKGKAKPWVDKRGDSGGKGGREKRGRNCAECFEPQNFTGFVAASFLVSPPPSACVVLFLVAQPAISRTILSPLVFLRARHARKAKRAARRRLLHPSILALPR